MLAMDFNEKSLCHLMLQMNHLFNILNQSCSSVIINSLDVSNESLILTGMYSIIMIILN